MAAVRQRRERKTLAGVNIWRNVSHGGGVCGARRVDDRHLAAMVVISRQTAVGVAYGSLSTLYRALVTPARAAAARQSTIERVPRLAHTWRPHCHSIAIHIDAPPSSISYSSRQQYLISAFLALAGETPFRGLARGRRQQRQ